MTEDRLARIRLLLGGEKLEKLKGSFVTVVGLGAVGSYAVEGLARAGIGRLRLVDFDVVRASNVNRQLYALGSTLGRRKADVAAERVLDINPHCRVEKMCLFAGEDTFPEILDGPPDLVVDAIDSLGPKAGLITECSRRGLKFISSMGAALRTDPSAVRVAPFKKTAGCPLAARLRRLLRDRKISMDFPCVYSAEHLGELRKKREMDKEEEGFEKGRQRAALGSLPTITAIFGLTMANTAIMSLSEDTGR